MNPDGEGLEQKFLDIVSKKYGAARPPKRVKPQERADGQTLSEEATEKEKNEKQPVEIRLNAAWHDLSVETLTPVAGVSYMWVIRDDEHLILGVEDPSKYPQAFVTDVSRIGTGADDLGHPTIGATFDQVSGLAMMGEGRIAGELKQESEGWVISDHSGRYSSDRSGTAELLVNAAELFRSLGVEVWHIRAKAKVGGTGDQVVRVDQVLRAEVK